MVGPRIFKYDQRVRARTGMDLTPIHSAANRVFTIVVQYQVRMPARAAEPVLDFALRLCDRRAHGMLGGGTVGIGRRAGNVALPLQTLAQLLFSLSHVFAQ